jgi:uncharacterized protein (TIGR03083 family)
MTPERFLDLLASDATLLADTADAIDLDAPVPTCPGWAARDAVDHTAAVYHHKIACMQLGRRPDEDEYTQHPAPGQGSVEFYREALAALLEELVRRGPAAPSYTWWPADQTVGFWYRRMAQETAVHRVDVQSVTGDVTHIDDDLALDGVDEVLTRFLAGDWAEEPVEDASGSTVAIRTGEHLWRVTLDQEEVALTEGPGPSHATVSGEPSELLLWLWGRRPLSAVTVEGDGAVIAELRERLSLATQ